MTLEEIVKRLDAMENELAALKAQVKAGGGNNAPRSWLEVAGVFKDDPAFEEAVRLGREWREQVNRESLEEMDREEAASTAVIVLADTGAGAGGE